MAGFKDTDSGVEDDKDSSITTGLLPNVLAITGTTRQNDLDVSFTIALNPGAAQANAASGGSATEHRQAFITFGDKSWGTVKLGKDLGIFAGTAILNDMTLLGVGGGHVNRASTTTLGGIGNGYIYADWKSQISYTTPNMNGFQATIGVTQPWDQVGEYDSNIDNKTGDVTLREASHKNPAVEGQVSYSWTGDVSGKVWSSFYTKSHEDITLTDDGAGGIGSWNYGNERVTAFDIGGAITSGNLSLVGYWYEADGMGTTFQQNNGLTVVGSTTAAAAAATAATAGSLKTRDSDGGYLQATYVIPTGTKLGVAYGISRLDRASGETKADSDTLMDDTRRWTVGAYHPLTKHLSVVAEYSDFKTTAHGTGVKDNKSDVLSLGAILFF